MLKICFIFVVSKVQTEEKEMVEEDPKRGDRGREQRPRERRVGRGLGNGLSGLLGGGGCILCGGLAGFVKQNSRPEKLLAT